MLATIEYFFFMLKEIDMTHNTTPPNDLIAYMGVCVCMNLFIKFYVFAQLICHKFCGLI